MNQLPFPYATTNAANGDLLQSTANAPAIAMMQSWLAQDITAGEPKGFILTGPKGAGKSHLLQIEARRIGALVFSGGSLPEQSHSGGTLPRQSQSEKIVFIDDASMIGADKLLAFYHRAVKAEQRFVIVGQGTPQDWARQNDKTGEVLPDLMTRLAALPSAMLPAPDEALLAMVFEASLAARQIRVLPETAQAAAQSLRRSLHVARDFAALVDEEALAKQHKVDKAFVRECLKNHPELTVFG
jgi:chromosomal replication initiation ATPase DnaA